jgi:predicted nuclease of predicted toxin-antitoxin system
MKFLCDVHISLNFVKFLNKIGFEAIHVNSILDGFNSKDSDIAKFADKMDLIIISKDVDFKNDFLIKGSPKKLIKINLGNVSNEEFIEVFEKEIPKIESIAKAESFIIEANLSNWTYQLKN